MFFLVSFSSFFWKILFFLQGEWDFQKQKKQKKTKKMDQFLTLEKAKIGPVFNSTAYIYILLLKSWPDFGVFDVEILAVCFVYRGFSFSECGFSGCTLHFGFFFLRSFGSFLCFLRSSRWKRNVFCIFWGFWWWAPLFWRGVQKRGFVCTLLQLGFGDSLAFGVQHETTIFIGFRVLTVFLQCSS